MGDISLDRIATVHSLLGSPTRLAFFAALAGGPKSGTQLADETGVSLSAVSQHMVKLREFGLVESSRDPNLRQSILFRLAEPVHPVVASALALLAGNGREVLEPLDVERPDCIQE